MSMGLAMTDQLILFPKQQDFFRAAYLCDLQVIFDDSPLLPICRSHP